MYNHISIDLDYFQDWEDEKSWKFYKKVKATGKPIFVFLEHHHVLRLINDIKYERIINIDYHDDIVDDQLIKRSRDEAEDYDWVNFYKYRKESIYEWRHPVLDNYRIKGYMRIGRCCDQDVWINNKTDWNNLEHHVGLRNLYFSDARNFSIIISPEYTKTWSVRSILNDIFLTYNMTEIIEKMHTITTFLKIQ